ncbi:hypothetical protein FTX61_13120 [Nitriliruptoraceae bacterium ZYF776]|nr:hypothetical protein [Profundirhabdus halotolerans]
MSTVVPTAPGCSTRADRHPPAALEVTVARRWRDDEGNELPPDPWAHAAEADAFGPAPDPARVEDTALGQPMPWDGAGQAGPEGTGPPPIADGGRRGLLGSPVFWGGLVVLALVLLVGALLEGGPRTDPAPSPGSVSTAPPPSSPGAVPEAA